MCLKKQFSIFSLIFVTFFGSYTNNAQAENTTAMQQLIASQCPSLSDQAISEGLTAYHNARAMGLDTKEIFTIVDYSQPSNKERFCTVDFGDHDVLFNALVSHGVRSGAVIASKFSNKLGSHKSSLGLFLTGEPYYGTAGFSLKLYGLDKGLNDNAASRHVVIHGTRHVSETIAKRRHRVGHSLGCFGLSEKIAPQVIDNLKGGTLLFAYYPSKQLQTKSTFLNKDDTDNLATAI